MALGFPGSNLMLQISRMAIQMQSKILSKSSNRHIFAVVHLPEDQIQSLAGSVDVYLEPCRNDLFYVWWNVFLKIAAKRWSLFLREKYLIYWFLMWKKLTFMCLLSQVKKQYDGILPFLFNRHINIVNVYWGSHFTGHSTSEQLLWNYLHKIILEPFISYKIRQNNKISVIRP